MSVYRSRATRNWRRDDDDRLQDREIARLVVPAFVAGPLFVLDGVLIGAGDGRYLAGAGVVTLVVFVPLPLAVLWLGGGLAALWWSFTGFMLARLATLLWRERSEDWLVLGATRRAAR